MNKKFLSAILFGALMVTSTGTFVSCKDYDEDIENLQTQIDKLATKDELTSQIASLQSALSTAAAEAAAAKTAAADALAKATAADKAAAQATLDAATAKAEAIAAAKAEVAAAKAALEEAVDAKFEDFQAELSATVADLTAKVEKLTGLTTEMITSIDLQMADADDVFALNLNYSQIPADYNKKKVYTFGKEYAGVSGTFDITPGEIFPASDELLVSVAPVNAVLPENIVSIINSNGAGIEDYVALTTSAYDGLLTRSANNGLWTIKAELKKDADLKNFAKKIVNDGKSVVFAVAASNEERTVTSTYDITISAEEVEAGEAEMATTIKSSIEEEQLISVYPGNGTSSPTTNNEECYPIVEGENFKIKVATTKESEGKVYASYVIVDKTNANLSTTDKAAINSLTFSGDFNAVSKENVFELKVSGGKGVVIPLRVVSVDYSGTVQEEVVWVKAGNSSAVAQTATFVVTPKTYVANPTSFAIADVVAAQAFTVPAGYDASKTVLSIVAEDANGNEEINITNAAELKFYEDAECKKETADASKIAYAKLTSTVNLQTMVDNKVYAGTVKFYNNEGTFLGQSAIKVQKVLPTAFPAYFSAKTNAINNGILTVYPVPAEDGLGVFDFNKSFNGLDEEDAAHLEFYSTDVNLIGDGDKKPENAVVEAHEVNNIVKGIINDGKTYGAGVRYDYGNIRSAYKVGDATSYSHKIDWATAFSIKFACMIVDSQYSWNMTPVVYYNEDAVIAGYDVTNEKATKLDVIAVKNAYNAVINPFAAPENGDASNDWATWAEYINASTVVTLKTTNEAGKVIENEYYTAAFGQNEDGMWVLNLTKKSSEVVLKADVTTSVVITITDKFGHEHDIPALTFTMKKSR